MMDKNYEPPAFEKKAFHCPHCGVYAQQKWISGSLYSKYLYLLLGEDSRIMQCDYEHCQKCSIWVDGKMVYPLALTSPPPHKDMPPDVKETYEEARQVQPFSARASAVLLRVALEQLTDYLKETEGDLYTRIGNLKKKGLPDEVIDCLDIVRINANAGVHAGREIDLEGEDNEEIVNTLFMLVNIIVEETISKKNTIKALKEELPENKKEGIKNRDSSN